MDLGRKHPAARHLCSLFLTSVGQAGDDDAAASSGCDHEAGLDDGDDGQTLRLRYHMSCSTQNTQVHSYYSLQETTSVTVPGKHQEPVNKV